MIKTRLFKFASVILDNPKTADKARTTARDEKQRKAVLNAARARCREFLGLRYCGSCHLAFDTIHSFCEKCSVATEPLPSPYALEYARAEFPDLVKTREDFDKLVGQ